MVLDKKELDRSIHLLEGLLKGIAFDQRINEREIDELNHWISHHETFRRHYPYTVLIPLLSSVLADRIITEDEKKDILWFCDKVSTENYFYNLVFSDLQRLHGIIHGILSDKIIKDEEIYSLDEWLNDNSHLRNHYPYDELVSIIDGILEDKKISARERQMLERYFLEFTNNDLLSAYSKEDVIQIKEKMTIGAVCAITPDITFKNHTFAITGQLSNNDKNSLVNRIQSLGGNYSHNVTGSVNYLVVMDTQSLLWAFEPYGRKIDQALALRTQGEPLVIVHKKDFLKALSI